METIRPDAGFIRDVMASGGGDLKKCFQCANCSAVCALAPEDAPFPRRQMIETQWGLKDRVLADPAIWLCHNCGDCTTYCPRGARPGDVLGALREQAVKHFAFPRFLAQWASSPKALPLVFLIPMLVFAAIALWAPKPAGDGRLEFANLFPIPVLEGLFFGLSGLVLMFFIVSLLRFVKAAGGRVRAGGVVSADVLMQKKLRDCDVKRHTGHLLIFWGFMGLAITGTLVGIGTMFGVLRTPLDLTSPFKLFANVAGLVAVVGIMMRWGSLRNGTYFDKFFFLTLAGVLATGILSQLMRLAQQEVAMYVVYFVHLTLIFALFLYAPFSKFAHLAYRSVALALVRKEGYGR
ncbi:MAG: quinone-interacting membrane-bound oxidoreductase complex subunit QmoC [Bryobacteraceae bacterium]